MTPARRTVLVVDDDPDVREIVGVVLGAAGYDVVTAKDGREALALVDAGMLAIILDWRMPGMSGAAFLATLAPDGAPALPVIVISGSEVETDVRITALLAKPIPLGDLLRIVDGLRDRCAP